MGKRDKTKCRCGLVKGHGGPCGQRDHPRNLDYVPVVKVIVDTKANPKKKEKPAK